MGKIITITRIRLARSRLRMTVPDAGCHREVSRRNASQNRTPGGNRADR